MNSSLFPSLSEWKWVVSLWPASLWLLDSIMRPSWTSGVRGPQRDWTPPFWVQILVVVRDTGEDEEQTSEHLDLWCDGLRCWWVLEDQVRSWTRWGPGPGLWWDQGGAWGGGGLLRLRPLWRSKDRISRWDRSRTSVRQAVSECDWLRASVSACP